MLSTVRYFYSRRNIRLTCLHAKVKQMRSCFGEAVWITAGIFSPLRRCGCIISCAKSGGDEY
ncbi:hypothetical protein KCP75_10135 [Salmonella enterica subsp. enterica]|nr:hypothetical protein KCP75_10135 [Salmonella enterica subsp. enterica]